MSTHKLKKKRPGRRMKAPDGERFIEEEEEEEEEEEGMDERKVGGRQRRGRTW